MRPIARTLFTFALILSLPAWSQGPSFDELASKAVSVDELVRAAQLFMRDCSCAKASVQAECERDKAFASQKLAKGTRVRVDLRDRMVQVGPFDRASRKLQISIDGGEVTDAELPACAPTDRCATVLEGRALGAPTPRLEVNLTADVAYATELSMDRDDAQLLESLQDRIGGELLAELSDVQTLSVPIAGVAAWKESQSRALQTEINELAPQLASTSGSSRHYVQRLVTRAKTQLACVGQAAVSSTVVRFGLKPVGQRLTVQHKDFPGYLLSNPPSSMPVGVAPAPRTRGRTRALTL